MTQHTPTPWRVGTLCQANGDRTPVSIDVISEGGAFVASLALNGQANAAFIVRACNAHDELVDELQRIIDEGEIDRRRIDGLLAKARGEA